MWGELSGDRILVRCAWPCRLSVRYSQLEKYDLPTPESVFELSYFREHPRAFCTLAREMFPGSHKPTATHALLRLLQVRRSSENREERWRHCCCCGGVPGLDGQRPSADH